jgi:hypothetical protein
MIIKIFIIPPFTYPNMSPYSYKIITVLWDLHMFLCPTNKSTTRVHLTTSPPERTFNTTGDLHLDPVAIGIPPAQGWPSSRPLAYAKALPWWPGPAKRGAKVHLGLHPRVSLGFRISVAFRPYPQYSVLQMVCTCWYFDTCQQEK